MKRTLLAASLGAAFAAGPALAADNPGTGILTAQCISCHAIAKPDNMTLDRLWTRKGPDLYYAGSKFNRAWLVKWMQEPVRVRPAGEFYTKHVKAGAKEDVVDESTLTAHVKLSKADAEAVADALMALTGPDGLVAKGAFKGDKVSMAMGAMFFSKLRGCAACHSAKPGSGGASGPELYTAGERRDVHAGLRQDLTPERMERADPHAVLGRRRRPQRPERRVQPIDQLLGRPLVERHHRDRAGVDTGIDQPRHPRDEGRGLARAGRCDDQHGPGRGGRRGALVRRKARQALGHGRMGESLHGDPCSDSTLTHGLPGRHLATGRVLGARHDEE